MKVRGHFFCVNESDIPSAIFIDHTCLAELHIYELQIEAVDLYLPA